MILKIAHITACTNFFDDDIAYFQRLGYSVKFVERDLNNPLIKKKLVLSLALKHDLAILDLPGSIDIELVRYHGSLARPVLNPYFIPVFKSNLSSKLFDDGRYAILVSPNTSSLCFDSVIIKTRDLDCAVKFWKNFGFKPIILMPKEVLLQFKSLLNSNFFYLSLQQDDFVQKQTYLDDNAFNCFAFITSSISKEKECLMKCEIETTGISTLVVNNKVLNIFFAKGPQGELVEIIGLNDK